MKKIVFLLSIYCLTFTPVFAQSVDLLWQGDGYTPPFYQGRTLWSSQTKATVIAVPQGLGNQANLNYRWTKNGTVLGNISGVGKNTLTFMDSVLSKPQVVKVEVVSSNGEVLAESSATLTPVAPSILIYENNPLNGFLFHRGVGSTYQLSDQEVTFTAFPLFFSASSVGDTALNMIWRTNSGASESKNTVTYRTPEGQTGSSRVETRVTNKAQILQDATRSFLVQFGNDE